MFKYTEASQSKRRVVSIRAGILIAMGVMLVMATFLGSGCGGDDDGSSGTASSYDIRYATGIITGENWNAADSNVFGEKDLK